MAKFSLLINTDIPSLGSYDIVFKNCRDGNDLLLGHLALIAFTEHDYDVNRFIAKNGDTKFEVYQKKDKIFVERMK